jgi:hypothetical protein
LRLLPPAAGERVAKIAAPRCHVSGGEQTVLGNFNNAKFTYAGVTSPSFKRAGKFLSTPTVVTANSRIMKSSTPSAYYRCSNT